MTVPAMKPAVEDDALVLSNDWSPLAQSVPGSVWDAAHTRYVLPRSMVNPRSAMIALKILPELGGRYPELVEAQADAEHFVRPRNYAEELKLSIDAPRTAAALVAERGKPRMGFQTTDLGYLKAVLDAHGAAYCGWERGMGKTMGAFSIQEAVGAERVMIVCNNTAKVPVWLEHVLNDYSTIDPELTTVMPNGKAKREEAYRQLIDRKHGSQLLIVHPESLDIVAKARANNRGWDSVGEWDLVIADEAHRFKNVKAKQTRGLKRIPAALKFPMSGSIIENSLEDLFSQLQWMFPTRYRSKWRDWNLRFIEYVDGPYGRIPVGVKQECLDELSEELGVVLCYRVKREEIEMPPRTDQTLLVDLTPGQRKAYDELATKLVSELDDGTVVAGDDGLPIMQKLRQVATGLDLMGNLRDSSKLDLIEGLVKDETTKPLVIFGWYKASLNALKERLGAECSLVHGDIPDKQRDEALLDFNRGRTRILLGTISTMGESVNLQRASHVILMDRHWNPMKNTQAEDRVDRMGQEEPVTVTHIVARGTVDELRVQPVIATKEALRRMVLGG